MPNNQFFKVKQSGFPKFKSRKANCNSFRVPQHFQIDFENKKIKIPKIDWIKFKDKRVFDAKIKSMHFSKNPSGQYHVSILVEEEFDQKLPLNVNESKVFSADMSAKDFLVSQEIEFEIVGTNEADPANFKISNESPMGKGFMGKKKGEEVEIEIPTGKVKYKILDVE